MKRCLTPVLAGLIGVVLVPGGCQLERLFPAPVADGIARLTMRNAAVLMSIVNDDTTCGFASPQVLENAQVEGIIGERGKIVYTVTDCEIDLGTLDVYSSDCNDADTSVEGRVVISAVRSVSGRLTGDPTTPVIPESSEAASIHIDATFTDYQVRRTDAVTALKIIDGSLSYDVKPHLAASASQGVCSVGTSNLTLSNVTWGPSTVFVDSGDRQFEAEVDGGELNAQLGIWGNKENWLEGELTVWGTTHQVPIPEEDPGLDPDYDTNTFLDSYRCAEDLALPITYECVDLVPPLAEGAAKLSVSMLGTLASLLDADENCGFISAGVVQNAQLTGPLGYAGGQVRYETNEPCRIEFVDPTPVDEDCNGKITYVQGVAYVSGTKTIDGIRTGDVVDPIVPTDRFPGFLSIDAQLEDFKVSDNVSDRSLTYLYGGLSGNVQPQTVIDPGLGVCAVPTPIATLSGVRIDDAKVALETDNKRFHLNIPAANLEAQNGRRGDRENYLAGDITVDNTVLPIPLEGEPILDPDYTPEGFFSAWSCETEFELPESDADCSPLQTFAEGMGSLLIAMAGSVASKVNANDECGFEDTFGVLIDPWQVFGDEGEMGWIIWKIADCPVGTPELTLHEQNCIGGKTYTQGTAVVDATRQVTGVREAAFDLFGISIGDSIKPADRQAVSIWLDDVELSNYSIAPYGAGATEPKGVLTVHSGKLTGLVKPVMGERASDPGVFDIATAAAVLEDIRLVDAQVTLESEGKTFKFYVEEAVLNATNGTWDGVSNRLEGWVTLDGEYIDLGTLPLDPDFDQATFDSSYACLDNLLEPVPVP